MARAQLIVRGVAVGCLVGSAACAGSTRPAGPTPEPPEARSAFRIYRSDGTAASMRQLVAAFRAVDAVLVGEEHDDSIGHKVELAILGAAHRSLALPAGRALIVSLEMFERDVQSVVDEYLAGLITEKHFRSSARPWDRYETDYRPLVEYAREEGLAVVAANAPRRYVNRVTRLGPESLADLPESARATLPPLPFPGPSPLYRAQWDSLMSSMARERRGPSGEPAPAAAERAPEAATARHPSTMGYALDAQALWDATMAESVARALEAWPGALVLHYAGSFHVERGTGIPEKISAYRPGTRLLTLVIRRAVDIGAFDHGVHEGLGDFVILTPAGAP